MTSEEAIYIAGPLIDAAASLMEPGEAPSEEYLRGIEDLILRVYEITGEYREILSVEIFARVEAAHSL